MSDTKSIKKFLPSLTLSQFSLLVAIWLGVALNLSFFEKIQSLTPYSGFKSLLFVMATVSIILAVHNILLQFIQWRYSAKPVAILLVFLGGLSAYAISSLGVIISPDQIQNMMQTDAHEAKDLMSWQFLVWCVVMVILPIILLAKIPLKAEKISKILLHKFLHIMGSLIVILILLFAFYVDYAAIFREHRDLKGMISPQNVIASSLSYYQKKLPKKNLPLVVYGEDAHLVKNTGQSLPKLMVLVVGETARAESFALNGYAKDTNPKLAKQAIINFSQVSSCGTATAVSLPCMFSGMTRKTYDEQLASHREGLLDIAQRAGYQVTWIENNSGCKKVCDRVGQYEIPKEIKAKWCQDNECYDEILVDTLQYYLATLPKQDTTPRLIVLHQMGSHGPAYYKRATAPYQRFKPTCDTNAIQGCSAEQLHNSYDNSIVYTDHVLSEMIDRLKSVKNYQTGFWYLSDHGESTGEHGLYLHGAPYAIAPPQQTHVPMLMWFSAAWQQQSAQQISCLDKQKQKSLSQDHLFPTLLHLLEVKSTVINREHDLLINCSAQQQGI